MVEARRKSRINLTLIMGVVAALLVIYGIGLSIVQEGSFTRLWQDLIVRPSGQFGFRFILQPIIAGTIGIRAGLRDAKEGRAPYFTRLRGEKSQRWDTFMEGLTEVANVAFLSVILDTLYQILVQGTFYPFETILVTLLLAFLPYGIARGLTQRLARRRSHLEPGPGRH
jgi:hypothetical protein